MVILCTSSGTKFGLSKSYSKQFLFTLVIIIIIHGQFVIYKILGEGIGMGFGTSETSEINVCWKVFA